MNSFNKNEWGIVKKSSIVSDPNKIEKNGQSSRCKTFFNFLEPRHDTATHYVEKPDDISICIKNDTNLPKIHLAVKDVIIFMLNDRNKIIRKCEEIVKKCNSMDESEVDGEVYNKLICSLESLEVELDKITKQIKMWDVYKEKSIPILNEYCKIMTNGVKKIISSTNNEDELINSNERINYILAYIDVLNETNIIDLNVSYHYDECTDCPKCGKDVSTNEKIINGKIVCDCGYYDEDDFQISQTPDADINLIFPKQKTDTSLVMDKWLSRFLGTSDDVFDFVQLEKDLNEKCIERGWPTNYEIKNGNYNEIDYNLQRLLDLLFASGHSKLYHLKNIIRHKYWGWKLPVLTEEQKSRFRNKIVETRIPYDENKKKDQNMNQDIQGWYHLGDVGAVFPLSWFKMTGNTEDFVDADEVYEKVCKLCEMTFVPIIKRK